MAWYVTCWENVNRTGENVKVNVEADGRGGIAADEFEKNGLQDKITLIDYCLPENGALVLYTGRFFKDTDGDLKVWFNEQTDDVKKLVQAAVTAGVTWLVPDAGPIVAGLLPKGKFGKDPLILRGTGQPTTVNLAAPSIAGGSYNDKVRSAKIVPC